MRRTQGQQNYQSGLWAEYLAAMLLWLKGYRLIKSRYKTRYGEIDLIVKKRDRLIFVEVKKRQSLLKAGEAVSPQSRERIKRTAQDFMHKHSQYHHCFLQFDVILVAHGVYPSHIKQAWI